MYLYHGYSLGVSSTVPGQEFTEASCGLACRGGVASAQSQNFDNKKGISFQSAVANISGKEDYRSGLHLWVIQASVIIQKLDVLGKLTADRITAQIYSEYRIGDTESSTVISGSGFENLCINGKPVTLETSENLSVRYPTFGSMNADFQNRCARDRVLQGMVGQNLRTLPSGASDDLQAAYDAFLEQSEFSTLKQIVVCSFVTKVNCSGGGFDTWGPIISLPGFGNIYLGELLVWPWMRCLNMLRIELSSGGAICAGSTGAGGTTFPPGGFGGGGGFGGAGGP